MGNWLDNYGKAENPNDTKLSFPKGFVGDGYSNKGRNFSPAWGGPYQKGGKIKKLKDEREEALTKKDNIQKLIPSSKIRPLSAQEKKERQIQQTIERQGQITQSTPQSTLSRVKEVALNPLTAFGYIARNESLPENFSRGERNVMDYAFDVVNPAQYVEDTKNVIQGTYNLNPMQVGEGLLGVVPLGLEAKNITKGVRNLNVDELGNKYLPNAYKYNPWAFKPNSEMGYRMLGKEGFDDAIETGVLRAKPIPGGTPTEGISLLRNTNRNPNTGKMQSALDRPYFADGFIDERYAADYMAAVNKADNNLIPIPTHKGIAPSQAGSIPLENATFYKKDWLKGYKQIEVPKQQSVYNNVNQQGFIDTKGILQKYPKGKLTQEEIEAFKNSDYYKREMSEFSKMKKRYGDSWQMENFVESGLNKAINTGDRSLINPILYGGNNWKAHNYLIAGAAATAYPSVAGLYALAESPTPVKNRVLKTAGIIDPTQTGFFSDRDTIIDITNIPTSYAKVNDYSEGNVILGGEFIEESNNTVRKAKDWLNVNDADTYSDKNYKSKDVESFYGVENGKFKVGKASDFNENTEIVARRFGKSKIKEAVLNGKEMRILDFEGNPIYQNTPNKGKFILYSPSTKKSQFVFINKGETGVKKVNDFLKENQDAEYIHLDNGRYEYYGINPEGLSEGDFKRYYEQDYQRKGKPGYNIVVSSKKSKYQQGGNIKQDNMGYWNPDNWGKPVEIEGNEITMEGVYEPLLGISDKGDVQLMQPGKNYKFKGNKVTEYPLAKNGKNIKNNNWLDKY